MERIDEVNDRLKLIQRTDGLTFGTDALLLAGYISGKHRRGIELGGGTGIISMLLLAREKVGEAVAVEVQPEYAELIRRNAELNSLDTLGAVCADVRDYRPEWEADVVYTNPPYMKVDSGKANLTDAKNMARHEVMGDIGDFCRAAKRMLRYGGRFAAVYRPDRLVDLIFEMREAGLEPKRMTFVHADAEAEPSMVLVEARADGKSGMLLTRPLLIYADKAHREYGEDMKYIMENGDFPAGFKR